MGKRPTGKHPFHPPLSPARLPAVYKGAKARERTLCLHSSLHPPFTPLWTVRRFCVYGVECTVCTGVQGSSSEAHLLDRRLHHLEHGACLTIFRVRLRNCDQVDLWRGGRRIGSRGGVRRGPILCFTYRWGRSRLDFGPHAPSPRRTGRDCSPRYPAGSVPSHYSDLI